jgi:hypothetical protein
MAIQAGTKAKLGGSVEKNPTPIPQNALAYSVWDIEHYRGGDLIAQDHVHNVCTAEGLNALLDIMFHGATQITTWYIAIFETDTTPSDATTYATPVYTETNAAYDGATRPEFVESAASSKSLSNTANKASFTMNATKTIYGAALVGGGSAPSTKGDTAGGGTLYCAAKFTTSKAVEDDDVLKVTVTLTASDV